MMCQPMPRCRLAALSRTLSSPAQTGALSTTVNDRLNVRRRPVRIVGGEFWDEAFPWSRLARG
jgi:hypothetical protein